MSDAEVSFTLPAQSSGGAWRTAWVGFDVALVAALLMRRSFSVIAQLRGQDPMPVALWRQPMIHLGAGPQERRG